MSESFNYGEYANNIHEASKNDQIIIVGSQIRQAIHAAFTKGHIDGRKHQARVDAEIAGNKYGTVNETYSQEHKDGFNTACDYIEQHITKEAKQI